MGRLRSEKGVKSSPSPLLDPPLKDYSPPRHNPSNSWRHVMSLLCRAYQRMCCKAAQQQQLYYICRFRYGWYSSAIGYNECDLIWFELGIGSLEPVAFSRVASDLSSRSLKPSRASNKWLPLVVSCSHWFVFLLQLLFSHRPVSHDGVFSSFVCFFTFQGWHMLSFLGFRNSQTFSLYGFHICLTASFSFLSDLWMKK